MWMAELKHGEHVGELPAYAPAFKEVYRFIVEALGGDDVAATGLLRKYLAGEMPEDLLRIARNRERAEQSNREHERPSRVQVPTLAA
jgi:predicted lipid-binding transport protein (Tim44 family)